MLLQFSDNRERACERFVAFVLAGVGIDLWVNLRQQIYLGDDQFVSNQQQYIVHPAKDKTLSEVPYKQRRKPARSLEFYRASCESTEAAVCSAFASGSYTQKAIADFFGLHYSSVSKMIARKV